MTIAYNWKITQTDYNTDGKFIFCAHWTASAINESFNASIYSTCSFAEGVATTPYADVTEAQVLGWCWAGGVDKEATEAALSAQIEAQKNPVSATGTPWSA